MLKTSIVVLCYKGSKGLRELTEELYTRSEDAIVN
jgi:hypothetical protein